MLSMHATTQRTEMQIFPKCTKFTDQNIILLYKNLLTFQQCLTLLHHDKYIATLNLHKCRSHSKLSFEIKQS